MTVLAFSKSSLCDYFAVKSALELLYVVCKNKVLHLIEWKAGRGNNKERLQGGSDM